MYTIPIEHGIMSCHMVDGQILLALTFKKKVGRTCNQRNFSAAIKFHIAVFNLLLFLMSKSIYMHVFWACYLFRYKNYIPEIYKISPRFHLSIFPQYTCLLPDCRVSYCVNLHVLCRNNKLAPHLRLSCPTRLARQDYGWD